MKTRILTYSKGTWYKKTFSLLVVLMLTSVSFITPSFCDDIYPAKNITWLIPYKPGGGHDISARAISPYLEKQIKKALPKAKGGSILIKNDPAGTGEKAISSLCIAPPDGYLIGSFAGAFLAERYFSKKDYDITKLTYLVRLDEMTSLVIAAKSGPKDWNEIVAASKTRPIKWGVGPFGRGLHVTSIIANEVLNLPAKFIPTGGTAETANALIRGDIQLMTISDDSAKSLLDAGEVKVLLTLDRKNIYPGAVSIQELGHPELVNTTKDHRFLAAPPGLRKETGKVIVEAFQKASSDDEFLAWSKKTGFELSPLYGNDLDRLLKEMMAFYEQKAPLIRKILE